MGSYLSEPVTEKTSADEANDKLKFGVSSMQGWRLSQEDAHNCILDFDTNTALFAVYDGHGGHEVARYCSLKLPQFIKDTEAYKSGDFTKALIDAFLGFDATIASREVVAELKEIAEVKEDERDSNDSDVEENVNNLYEEAAMPLEQVIEKYTSNLKHPHIQNMQKDGHKPVSLYLRARKDPAPVTNESCSKSDANSSTVECSVSGPSSKNQIKVELTKESEKVVKKHLSEETDKKTDDGTGDNKPNQNGEIEPLDSNVKNEKHDAPQENGEICKKGKGKASIKTKGVPESTPVKTRPKRTVRELYNKILEIDTESESEDEEDKTFQGPNDSSSDDDNAKVGGEEDNSEVSSELEDEGDELDEEDVDEYEEDECGMSDESLEFARNMREEPGSDSGCTAVVALLKGNELCVANAGDSRCIVCRNGKAVDMSFDHKPEDEQECERIVKAGGKLTSDGRVNGGLNLSRAIGDHAYKQNKELSDREQMITALPDVRTLTINPGEDEFMVLACDGIWNSMTSQQVVDFVKPKLEDSPEKISRICEEMFGHCLAPDTMSDGTGCDNMTAIIVQFKTNLCKRAAPSDTDESENVKRVKTDETVTPQPEVTTT